MAMAQLHLHLLAAFFIPTAGMPNLEADGLSEAVPSSGIARAKRGNAPPR